MQPTKINRQKYEYVVEVINDLGGLNGGTDLAALNRVLQKRSAEGYRLVSTHTNELGKNSVSFSGVGTNATLDETILIFEREARQDDETFAFQVKAPIVQTNLFTPFGPCSISVFQKEGATYVTLNVSSLTEHQLSGLQCDLIVRSKLGDEFTLYDVCFFSFEKAGTFSLTGAPFPIVLPDKILLGISDAVCIVKRYICDGNLEIIENPVLSSQVEQFDETFDVKRFLAEIGEMSSANEILKHIQHLIEDNPTLFSAEFMEDLSRQANIERMYGRDKNSAVKLVSKYLSSIGLLQ